MGFEPPKTLRMQSPLLVRVLIIRGVVGVLRLVVQAPVGTQSFWDLEELSIRAIGWFGTFSSSALYTKYKHSTLAMFIFLSFNVLYTPSAAVAT